MNLITPDVTSIKWHFNWERRMTYQKMRLFSSAYQIDIPKIFGVSLTAELYRVKDLVVSECYESVEYQTAFLNIEKKLRDPQSIPLLNKLAEYIRGFEEEFKPYVDTMPTKYSSFTKEELAHAYLEFCKVERNISFANWILFAPFEEMITKTLRRALENRFNNAEEADTLIKAMSFPEKIIPLDVHNKTIYEIALSPKDKQPELLDRCAQTFIHWGMFDVIYPEATRESFVKKVADAQGLDLPKLLNEIKEKYSSISEKQIKIRESLRDNEYISSLLNLYSHYANYKDWKNYYREQSSYKLKHLLAEIAKQTSLTLTQVAFLSDKETIEALNAKLLLSHEEMDKRIKNSAYVFLSGELYITTDPFVLAELDKILEQKTTQTLKGSVGYPGIIRGVVRIILSNNDFHKLLPGEILVTSTTRPDFVPIMEKAAGFITNEGGLLSHAAIVAREMKKPCVIGTKNATQILKDGDLVEMDANTGVVKIVK